MLKMTDRFDDVRCQGCKGNRGRVMDGGVDAVRALDDASKASVSDYYIHTSEARPVRWQQDCAGRQISKKRR
jgi:hypothetical protein